MKKLQKQFNGRGSTNGFTFTQIKEGSKSYIYEVFTGHSYHWEVFQKKNFPETVRVIDGKEVIYKGGERYPSDDEFGKWAYCCNSLKRALERMEEFEN
jgi:hypothetical protein